MKTLSGFCLLNCKIAMKCEKERRLAELWSGVEGLVKTKERVAMKRRENMAETKIWEEKKLRRLNPPRQNPPPPPPPRLPLTATAIQFQLPRLNGYCRRKNERRLKRRRGRRGIVEGDFFFW